MDLNVKQQQLYQQVILEHNKKPRNFQKPALYNRHAEGFNPLCGDHVWVYLLLDADENITDIAFQGEGCALCKASASMMTTALIGKPRDAGCHLATFFTKWLASGLVPATSQQQLGSLVVFSGIWQYPSRIKCVSLAWHAALEALRK